MCMYLYMYIYIYIYIYIHGNNNNNNNNGMRGRPRAMQRLPRGLLPRVTTIRLDLLYIYIYMCYVYIHNIYTHIYIYIYIHTHVLVYMQYTRSLVYYDSAGPSSRLGSRPNHQQRQAAGASNTVCRYYNHYIILQLHYITLHNYYSM